jgi:serine/threonine-protein kinase
VKRSGEARLTSTGAVMGTPLYMAPEQVRGQRDLDHRADLHSVGVMLYEMLAGRTPYQGEQFGSIAHQILTGEPPQLREVAPDVDAALAELVMKSFALEREARFATARELREALEAWQPGQLQAEAFAAPRPSMLTDLGRPTRDGPARKPTTPAVREVTFAAEEGADVPLELDRPVPPPSEPEPPPRSRAPLRIAIAGAAVALIGAGAWVATAKLRGPMVQAPSHYQVINLPVGARVYVDNVPTGDAFDVDPARPHTFRIELRGKVYRPLVLDEHADPTIDGAPDRKH